VIAMSQINVIDLTFPDIAFARVWLTVTGMVAGQYRLQGALAGRLVRTLGRLVRTSC